MSTANDRAVLVQRRSGHLTDRAASTVEPSVSSDLAPFVDRIERAYQELGHNLGWRFLNGPATTLSPESSLAFVGLNPGGDVHEPPMASVEQGNAYRVERWGPRHTLNPLQRQVRALYDELSRKLGAPTEQLMDATLAWNFCPFRSPSWARLASRPQSLAFSKQLGASLLEIGQPDAIVCLGDLVSRQLGATLEAQGARRREATSSLVGWGEITYELAHFESRVGATLVVRLPHLSRFAIFGRQASALAVDRLTDAIAQAVGDRGCATRGNRG